MKQGTQSWCSETTQRDGVGKKVGKGFRMRGHMHPWLIHVNVLEKPSQCCKVIILQLFSHSCIQLCAILWTVAHQAPLSKGLFRQEYWSGLPFLPPGNLPNPEIKPMSPASPVLQVDSLPVRHQGGL